eukprot:2445512-Prymnesium_polylepis.1
MVAFASASSTRISAIGSAGSAEVRVGSWHQSLGTPGGHPPHSISPYGFIFAKLFFQPVTPTFAAL